MFIWTQVTYGGVVRGDTRAKNRMPCAFDGTCLLGGICLDHFFFCDFLVTDC